MPFANTTAPTEIQLPTLPDYTLHPVPELIPGIPDVVLRLIMIPTIYWASGLIFHLFDAFELLQSYKLHEPEEIATRNRVSLGEVVKSVLIQQALQTGLAVFGIYQNGLQVTYSGKEPYDVAKWAQSLRRLQGLIPVAFSIVGIDASGLAKTVSESHPLLAGALRGGKYPWLTQTVLQDGLAQELPAFAPWELASAQMIYWFIIPAVQFGLAIFVIDLWQYIVHRLMHTSKFLYSRVHAVHHKLYVPFAWGALYNHPFEGFLLDTMGAVIASELARLSVRQSMLFFALTNIKTIDDHSGYSFPWDPLQFMTPNNVVYHDIHHQHWGLKTNFSQPFLVFWDRCFGTEFKGDSAQLYKKNAASARIAVQKRKDVAKLEESK